LVLLLPLAGSWRLEAGSSSHTLRQNQRNVIVLLARTEAADLLQHYIQQLLRRQFAIAL
jgi:hypothetical protein